MCLLDKPLAKSHLIPAGAYKYCRKGEHRPIRISRGIVLPTDEQTQAYLLCDDCEEILNSAGERWVVSRLLSWEKKFPLYDLLTQQKADFDVDDALVYCAAKNSQIEIDKLTHFALGIFWKASVYSWDAAETEPRIQLGSYSDRIRLWLRSEGEFPQRVHLVAVLSRPQMAKPSLCEPFEQSGLGWLRFDFRVPGLLFILNIGTTVDAGIRAVSVNTPPHAIHVDDRLIARSEQLLLEHFQRNRKPTAFWDAMKKIGREGHGPK